MTNTHNPARSRNGARICTIIGFVFAALAIFLFPLIFGLVAVVLGIIGASMGDKPLGWYAAGAGVLGAVIGLVLAAAVMNA